MRDRLILKFSSFLCLIILSISASVHAFETEQYSLPPEPLQDSGSLISEWVYDNLAQAVAHSNSRQNEIGVVNKLLSRLAVCEFGKFHFNSRHVAGVCISEHVENELSKKNRPGSLWSFVPKPSIYTRESTPGRASWLYNDEAFDSPYFWRPFSGSAQMYGHEVGLDKIGHFLKLGREYFNVYLKEMSKHQVAEIAEAKAITNIGVHNELGKFGVEVSGIFSNADLAANYSGLRFYQMIFFGATIQGQKFGPLVNRNSQGVWELIPAVKPGDLLRPFITAHWSEALNPSWYTEKVKELSLEIKKRCDAWKNRYPLRNGLFYEELWQELQTWDGKAYGVRPQPEGPLTVGRICYLN